MIFAIANTSLHMQIMHAVGMVPVCSSIAFSGYFIEAFSVQSLAPCLLLSSLA